MKHRSRCACLLLSLPLLAAAEPPAATPPPSEDVTTLGPVIVHGKRNPLDDIDGHLKALQRSLPGPEEGPKKNFLDWYAANRDPENLSEASKKQLLNMSGRDQSDQPVALQLQRP